MSDIDPLLDAIEDSPAEDFPWQVLADWLEERADPLAEILRRTIELRDWAKGFDQVARVLSVRDLQLLACDIVEPLLVPFERRFPRNQAARQLVEGLRLSQEIGEIRGLHRDLSGLSWRTNLSWQRPNARDSDPMARSMVQAAADCLTQIIGGPRRTCVRAVIALAHEKSGVVPSRRSSESEPGTLRTAIEVEFRRLIVKAIRRHLDSPGP